MFTGFRVPRAVIGVTKYGPTGLYSKDSFKKYKLSEAMKKSLAEAANYSIAKQTWSSYKTVGNMLEKCQMPSSGISFSY